MLRSRDPHDERNRVLTLTAAGKALRKDGVRIAESIAHACALTHGEVAGMMVA